VEYKYHAIILSKFDVAETDRVYSAYTQEAGKVRLLAKGVRKSNAKLAGNLESLTFSEVFVARARGRGNVTGVIALQNFLRLKEDAASLEKVFSTLKIFNRLITEEEQDENIFALLLEYLRAMDALEAERAEEKREILAAGFLFKLLSGLGYEIQVKKCSVCASPLRSGENYFNAPSGGVICAGCGAREAGSLRVKDEVVKIIRIFLDNKMENLGKIRAGKESLNNLKIVLTAAVRWITG
jgi:DNA repair protein RecO (recombination protein O)